MFRAFGHDKVWVLDGGLPNWKANNYPVESDGSQVESGQEAVSAVHKVYAGEKVSYVILFIQNLLLTSTSFIESVKQVVLPFLKSLMCSTCLIFSSIPYRILVIITSAFLSHLCLISVK